jgi:MshEN domain
MSETAISPPPSVAGLAPGTPGITPPSDPNRRGAFLTDVMVELGFASREQVDEAVDAARQLAKTPERYLLESGAIDERQLSIALAERNGLDHVDLDHFEVDPEATSLIDKPIAARYSALPIGFAPDGALLVALQDPCDMLGVTDIEVMTRNDVRTVIAMGAQIQALIERLPDRERLPAADRQPAAASEAAAPPEVEPEVVRPEAPPEVEPEVVREAEPRVVQEVEPEGPTEGPPAPAPLSAPPDPAARPSAPPEPDGEDDVELGELSAALGALGDRMREAGDLAKTAERRINELEEVDARAQKAAAALDDERSEFERKLEASTERERQLEAELAAARERIEGLERRQAELASAAELARAATEQLAELQRVLQGQTAQ